MSKTRRVIGLQRDLVRRPAIVPHPPAKADTSGGGDGGGDPPMSDDGSDRNQLAASVGQGNLMVATWVLGNNCDGEELGARLAEAPFDCTVLVMSAAVAESDAVVSYLRELADMQWIPHEEREGHISDSMAYVLQEKTIVCLCEKRVGHSVSVCLHRAKIKSARYEEMQHRSRGREGIQFGTLRLDMDQTRQRTPQVAVGIVDVRRKVDEFDTAALVHWVIMDRIAMLTVCLAPPTTQGGSFLSLRSAQVPYRGRPCIRLLHLKAIPKSVSGSTQVSSCFTDSSGASKCLLKTSQCSPTSLNWEKSGTKC